MKLYIAYKFSNIKDKKSLKEQLLKISKILESFGHETYILGRDAQEWGKVHYPIHHKFMKILKEVRKADGVFFYVHEQAFSRGLLLELHLAKLFGKKTILALKEGVEAPYIKLLSQKTVVFSTLEDLKQKLK